MRFLSFLLFLIFFAFVGALPSRMIGGKPAKPGQFPFVVSYHKDIPGYNLQICVGTILNNQWVLTAAHCFWPYTTAEDIYVSSGTNKYNLTKIVPHPNFNPAKNIWNDLALTKIDGFFEFTDLVQSIEIGDVSTSGTFVGWDSRVNDTVAGLQYVDVSVLSEPECLVMGAGSSLGGIPRSPGQVCTFSKHGGLGACFGGAGGPLIDNNTLTGVVSYSLDDECSVHEYPDVFTRVRYYKEWIKTTVESKLQ